MVLALAQVQLYCCYVGILSRTLVYGAHLSLFLVILTDFLPVNFTSYGYSIPVILQDVDVSTLRYNELTGFFVVRRKNL